MVFNSSGIGTVLQLNLSFCPGNKVRFLCLFGWLLSVDVLGTEGGVSNYQVKQLEQQNERMKEAIVK